MSRSTWTICPARRPRSQRTQLRQARSSAALFPSPWARRNPKPLFDLLIDQYRGFGLDRDCDAVANGILNAAGVLLAPDLQREVTVIYKRDRPAAEVPFMKKRAFLDRCVSRLSNFAPLDSQRCQRLISRRF